MDISFFMKIAGIALLVAVVCQILSKIGKDDQSGMVSIGGMIVILIILIEALGELIITIRDVFGF